MGKSSQRSRLCQGDLESGVGKQHCLESRSWESPLGWDSEEPFGETVAEAEPGEGALVILGAERTAGARPCLGLTVQWRRQLSGRCHHLGTTQR